MKTKVVSFNIRSIDDNGGNTIPERAPRLHNVVMPYDADVIGFQEYTPAWEEHIEKYFGDKYEIFNKYRTQTGWLESAPILWKKEKLDCVKRGYFWLSDTPEVESRGWDTLPHNRICLWAILKDRESGKEFTFMNTHFGFSDECQVKSAALVSEYARKLSPLPTFITGDFNMTPESLGYAEITRYFTDVNTAIVNDMGITFHGYNEPQVDKMHIDYCFIDNKIKPLTQRIINELVDGKFPSDHYGIYAEIEF